MNNEYASVFLQENKKDRCSEGGLFQRESNVTIEKRRRLNKESQDKDM